MIPSRRAGVGAVALWCALGVPVSAKTRTEPPAPPAPECDAMCEIGAYLGRDHMVVAVPADDAGTLLGAPARKAAKPIAVKIVAHTEATRPKGGSAARSMIPPRRNQTAARTEAPARTQPRTRTRALALAVPAEDPPQPPPQAETPPRPRSRREARRETATPSLSAVPAVIPGSAPLVATQFESAIPR